MKKLISLAVVLSLPTWLFAGSIFSGNSIGLTNQSYGGRETGMGLIGIALPDSEAVGALNPALWAGINLTRFSLGANFCRNSAKDEYGSDLSDKFSLQIAALGIRLGRGLVLGVRVFPESRMDYRIVNFRSAGALQYEDIYIGSGGLSSVSALIAGKYKQNIWIGAGADLLFGDIDTRWRTIIASTSTYSEFSKIDNLLGLRYNIGLYYQYEARKALGLYASTESRLEMQEEWDYSYSDSTLELDKELIFPTALGIGYSFPLNTKITTNIDFLWNGWRGAGQDLGDKNRYQNSQFFGIGFEKAPSVEPFTPFIRRITYRGGATLRNLYYQTAGGKTVSELALSLGAGLPLKAESARLDINLSWGKRGALNINKAEEWFFNAGLYLNAGEKWFVRKKRY